MVVERTTAATSIDTMRGTTTATTGMATATNMIATMITTTTTTIWMEWPYRRRCVHCDCGSSMT
jgi:hypothetical protein